MAVVNHPSQLEGAAVFDGLSGSDVDRLMPLLHQRTFRMGESLMMLDQPAGYVYLITKGAVKVHAEQANGSDVIYSVLGPGDILGEMGVMENVAHSASVSALQECETLWMDRQHFRQCVETMPQVTSNLLHILSRRVRLLSSHVEVLASLDVYGRLATQLLAFASEFGKERNNRVVIPIRLTQSDLASLVGASRERVNQAVAKLKQEGHLSVSSRHYIALHNPQALTVEIQDRQWR